MKRLLTIGFALSGLLLIAWPFDVFAKLHGISPHIQLANRHVFHEEPTDFSFLTFFLYPGVWVVSLVLARRAIKERVRKTRAMIWTLVPFAWIVVLGYTGNAVRYAKEEEWVRKDRKIGLLHDRISASNLSLSEREAAPCGVQETGNNTGCQRELTSRVCLQTKRSALTANRSLSTFTCVVVRPRSPFRIR